jgi:mannitol/fructose-specific phosphotransferase system IIA component (Ntr-type)
MTLGQFTEPKLLIPRLLSDRQDGAIQELTERLEVTHRIQSAPAFLEAVRQRETEMPTFLDCIAVPHVRGESVKELFLAVGLSATGIPWGWDKRRVARVVFLFGVPWAEAPMYLSLLSGLSRLVQDKTAFEALRRATEPEEMLSSLNAIHLVRRTARPGSAPTP